jgi:hypothetical protein
MNKDYVIKISHKALIQLLRIGVIDDTLMQIKERYYVNGESYEDDLTEDLQGNIIGIEVGL